MRFLNSFLINDGTNWKPVDASCERGDFFGSYSSKGPSSKISCNKKSLTWNKLDIYHSNIRIWKQPLINSLPMVEPRRNTDICPNKAKKNSSINGHKNSWFIFTYPLHHCNSEALPKQTKHGSIVTVIFQLSVLILFDSYLLAVPLIMINNRWMIKTFSVCINSWSLRVLWIFTESYSLTCYRY